MAKGKKSKIWHEQICEKHGTPEGSPGRTDNTISGSPPNHTRGIKYSGCPVCRAEEKKTK